MQQKCYYAHCIAIYNTPQEVRDLQTLQQLGFEVANPNTPECAEGYKKEGMPYFQRFADSCDVIAFRGIPGGAIPAGVGGEIKMFQDKGKKVYELPSRLTQEMGMSTEEDRNIVEITQGLESRIMSVQATRQYLIEVGKR